ncbi:MAG TPA: peptidase S10 [Hyphomicrobiaceae bacterium]
MGHTRLPPHNQRPFPARRIAIQAAAAAAVCLLLICGAAAQDAGGGPAMRVPLGALEAIPLHPPAATKPEPPLPAEATTHHSLALPDRTLAFTAKAGAMVFEDPQGAAVAEIGYFAYLLDGDEPRTRPVTFVINGGPGSASAWLQLGAMGPWRLPITQAAAHPTAAADLLPNGDTWLDFTDLVFIDPVGTGYSRFHQKDKATRDKFWSVDGDIGSIVVFIKRWLETNGRLDSPKLFAGESYGGFRAPRVAQALQAMPGLALNGIVLVSPVLADRGAEFPGLGSALGKAVQFPSVAAAIAEARGPVGAQQLAVFERTAVGEYLGDLLAGPRDAAAVERLALRMAALTGLDIATVRQIGPRSAPSAFLAVLERRFGRTFSNYDATERREAAYDGPALIDGGDDLSGLYMQLARAMTALTQGPLGWKPQREYHARGQGAGWSWSGQESVSALRGVLVRDPTFRVLVVHGHADLIAPYLRTKLTLDQMPTVGADNSRVRLEIYGGGHMFYSRDASRAQFRQDALRLYEEIAASKAGRAFKAGSDPSPPRSQ